VPANRWGSNVYSPVQLKMLQEIITPTAFCVFAFLYFDEKIRWNHIAASSAFRARWRSLFCPTIKLPRQIHLAVVAGFV
jgi:uncharacterized protein (DUF486 family)